MMHDSTDSDTASAQDISSTEDYASTRLYNLIAEQLSNQGIDATSLKHFSGKTERTRKALLLDHALALRGPKAILEIGQYAHLMRIDPAASVLIQSTSPQDLISRWIRLERFYHGRHRVKLLGPDTDANKLMLEHYAVQGPAPGAGEDILIAGLLSGIIQLIGGSGISLEMDGVCLIKNSEIQPATQPCKTAQWSIAWQAFQPSKPLYDEASISPRNTDQITEQVALLIRSDPGRSWRINSLAGLLGTSVRSLQRALKSEGETFQGILRKTRVDASVGFLKQGEYKIADAGYAAGFSDQAHFSRDFKLRFNLTPRQYLALYESADK